jgi:hypothetical protein
MTEPVVREEPQAEACSLFARDPEQWASPELRRMEIFVRRPPGFWRPGEIARARDYFDALGRRPVSRWGPARPLWIRWWIVSAFGAAPFVSACVRAVEGVERRSGAEPSRAYVGETAREAFQGLNVEIGARPDFFDTYEPALSYGRLEPWLRGWFFNHARRVAEASREPVANVPLEGLCDEDDRESLVERLQCDGTLERLLLGLTPLQRLSIELTELEGLDAEEAALEVRARLGGNSTAGSIRVAKCRAMGALREALARQARREGKTP